MIKEHPDLGPRGSATINTSNRRLARRWLSDLKIPSSIYNALSIGELAAVYNDTSDAELAKLTGKPATPPPAPPAPPAPATPAPSDKASALADAIGALVGTPDVDLTEIETAVSTLGDRVAAVEAQGDAIRDLADALASDKGGTAKRARAVAASTKNPVLARLLPYYSAGAYNGGNIANLTGPAGFGKSHAVRELGKDYDVYLEHGCSEDIDEISTLLGSIAPDGAGGFITVDGVLTEAFRAAAGGKTTLLLLDEHLRWAPRTQEFMLVTFTPCVNSDGDEVFRLRTRRPDGDTLETIEAPVDKLHLVGASNLEAKIPRGPYWDRFLHVRLDFDEKALATVCQSILDGFGIPETKQKLATVFAGFIGQSRKDAAEGKITFPLSPRDLKRAALFAPEATENAVAGTLAALIADKVQSWDADTGDRLEDGGGIRAWSTALKAIAKAKPEAETETETETETSE